MWIFKIGGSWIMNHQLDELLSLISKFNKEKISIVTGGGCFADSVREAFNNSSMDENTGNFLALKATEIFAHFLKCKDPIFFLSEEENEFYKKKIKVWLPSNKLLNDSSFLRSWNSTSDSVAAWLGNKIFSSGIIFIKSLSFESGKTYSLKELQKQRILDKNLNFYLSKDKTVKIVGPEIIEYLKESKTLNELICKLCDVSVK